MTSVKLIEANRFLIATMESTKLITISYRLPERFSVMRSKLVLTPSAGGLATALSSYFAASDKKLNKFESLHWIGASDISKKSFDKVSDSETIEKNGVAMHPIFLPDKLKENFHEGFCNSVVWPLFLYFPSFAIYKNEFFDGYVKANELMLEKVLEVYNPGDTIWIHDYHWMLLPTLLRERLPDAKIGFFLHIPFPSFELYRLLPKPWRVHLLLGLMGADVVGFQTDEFAKHFITCVDRVFPDMRNEQDVYKVGKFTTALKSFPISIDFKKFSISCRTPQVRKNIKRIREGLSASRLILSVDRLDYTKAIFSRLESFEMFLEQNPDFRGKVSYLLLLVPTRESIPKYKENKLIIEALISRINGKYGSLSWVPIVYQYQIADFKKLVAMYGACDIALVVPARDGMNLVSKEYVASRSASDGVLILSETAGAATELREAIIVNPNDRQEISDAILEALLMTDDEQKYRMKKMQRHIEKNNVDVWATSFLSQLETINQQMEVEA